jgi:hypothetical protein
MGPHFREFVVLLQSKFRITDPMRHLHRKQKIVTDTILRLASDELSALLVFEERRLG